MSSVVIEAYRHLVDDAGVPERFVRPRLAYTVPVSVTRILDLTDPDTAEAVGLSVDHLSSKVGDYDACQDVAAAARALGLHGVLAPSAEGDGTTLALFIEVLPATELPTPTGSELWEHLPDDPRRSHSESESRTDSDPQMPTSGQLRTPPAPTGTPAPRRRPGRPD